MRRIRRGWWVAVLVGLFAAGRAAALDCAGADADHCQKLLHEMGLWNIDCSVYSCEGIIDVQASGNAKVEAEVLPYRKTLPDCTNIQAGSLDYPPDYEDLFTPLWLGWEEFQRDVVFRMGVFGSAWNDKWAGDLSDGRRPQHLVMTTMAVLAYGATATPGCSATFDSTTVYCNAGRLIDETQPACKWPGGDADASMSLDWLYGRRNVLWLYEKFFAKDAIRRAGTVAHEVRHADGCTHNGPDYEDLSWLNGCAEYQGAGAWAFEIYYLADYARRSKARGYWTTSATVKTAVDAANALFNNFSKRPCFVVDSGGNIYTPDTAANQFPGCGDR